MGPAVATINAVLRTGWKPARPDLWNVAEGINVQVSKEPFARFQTIARAHHDLQVAVWKRAAEHEHGKGLETGIPSMHAARDATRYLHKHGHHVQARALEYILVGFFRDPEDTMPKHKRICNRCARGCVATRFHITYECEDNTKIEADFFAKSVNHPRSIRWTQNVPVLLV